MENKFKEPSTPEVEKKPKKKLKVPRFRVTAYHVDKYLRFFIFLVVIGLVYIWNAHRAEKQIRKLENLKTEIRELKSEYTALSSELSFGTRQSQVIEQVDTLGLQRLTEAPYKLEKNRD